MQKVQLESNAFLVNLEMSLGELNFVKPFDICKSDLFSVKKELVLALFSVRIASTT